MAVRLARLAARSVAVLQLQENVVPAAAARLLMASQHQACLRELHSSATPRSASQEAPAESEEQRRALINRMLYRSRQRGFLELDLLVGMWAEKELPRMTTDLIREFEVVLDQENPDMFKWLTAQEEAPEELRQNRAFAMLRQHVKTMTDRHHSVPPPAAGEQPKEWVRGWTDSGKELAH